MKVRCERSAKSISNDLAATKRLLKALKRPDCRGVADALKLQDFDPETAVVRTDRLLVALRSAEILRSDPYIKSGFSPSENHLSNALAEIIDPFARHYQGTVGLRSLLVAAELLASPSQLNDIKYIQGLLRGGSHLTRVYREHAFELGRIDLRVVGSRFEILVENKLRGGSEVVLGGRSQTIRYEALIERAKKRGCRVMAIYLTPEGNRASSQQFISVSTRQFSESLIKEMAPPPIGQEQNVLDSWTMMRAFALTYDRFNCWRAQ